MVDGSSRTVAPKPACLVASIERPSEVTINNIADMVVAFDSSVAEPRGPKAVCEPIPPNAPAKSAAFPLCSKTTTAECARQVRRLPALQQNHNNQEEAHDYMNSQKQIVHCRFPSVYGTQLPRSN
ncbi:hypothetical protein SBA3_4380010 [Candidatus Sulfopaludibacter sp. SbA3]|nr:hypothetical protein SBA3_4380010 [Candidatus Sulfopaludibacter sp. SbA3]